MNTVEEEKFNTALGKQVMIVRMRQRMSMDQLGAHLGVTGQQITKYETGASRMPPEKIKRCCDIFNVPIDYFFGETASAIAFDKSIITIAAEINDLPLEIRKAVYNLGRVINKSLEQVEIANNEDSLTSEKAA
jgi:transcriptional regulator with XRE-family HTH domain